MAVTSGLFLFEVVIGKVDSLVPSRHLIIKSDFGEIFSLELKDPKTMHIVMPEPLPLPPDPPGKKKKKKPPKPKKGKKGAIVAPPPEPAIQSGQSVLFGSSAEFLIQSMAKCPLEVSLWSKEDNLTFIGSVAIPWDPIFVLYLRQIADNREPAPVVLKEDYNIFEEGKAKMMAKIGLQVKLSFLTSKLTTSFRTLSEDLNMRKYLYTGINSKTTSYMCTLKTTDENFEENSNKIPNNFVIDKPSAKVKQIAYADYKNANLGANLTFFNEGDYCCMSHADKPPESIYKSPETCPDIDHIIDYVRKIIVSCNDNMRMLTPKPTIRPRVKATDIDRLCYCKETEWPEGELAERFKKEAKSDPCPLCIDAGKKVPGARGAVFDIGNIRGPCGRPDCKIAREIRAYIEELVNEDNVEFNLEDLIGPCGSKDCTLAEKILEFLQHEGAFAHDNQLKGLSTQCGCLETMQKELTRRESCASICSKDCERTGSDASSCGGPGCPYLEKKKVYNVYYFTVEHDFDKDPSEPPKSPTASTKSTVSPGTRSESPASSATPERAATPITTTSPKHSPSPGTTSPKVPHSPDTKHSPSPGTTSPKVPHAPDTKASPATTTSPATTASPKGTASPQDTEDETDKSKNTSKFPHCPPTCPSVRISENISCSKTACSFSTSKLGGSSKHSEDSKCMAPVCPPKGQFPPSPADSNIVIDFDEINNPCCVKSCDMAEQVKDFIEGSVLKQNLRRECAKKLMSTDDPCYCDCVCTFKFSSKTTYCPVCGGYQCLGDDVRNLPAFRKPHPCPVYHKLYDKKYIKTPNPWPDEDKTEPPKDGGKSSKIGVKSSEKAVVQPSKMALDKEVKTKEAGPEKSSKSPPKTGAKKVGKFTVNVAKSVTQPATPGEKPVVNKYPYPPVPKNMGWNWTAEDIPGMKVAQGWKPGAISKRLLKKLNEAKTSTLPVKTVKLHKKIKRNVESKPTLIVSKMNGAYHIEMQVSPANSEANIDQCSPVKYTVKSEDNENRVQKRLRKRHRLIKEAVEKVWSDPYHPEVCERTCLKAYKQAIGLLPYDPNNPECNCCSEEEIKESRSSSCDYETDSTSDDSSLDLQWEIHFTPPSAKS